MRNYRSGTIREDLCNFGVVRLDHIRLGQKIVEKAEGKGHSIVHAVRQKLTDFVGKQAHSDALVVLDHIRPVDEPTPNIAGGGIAAFQLCTKLRQQIEKGVHFLTVAASTISLEVVWQIDVVIAYMVNQVVQHIEVA